jgi:hypothetical protein
MAKTKSLKLSDSELATILSALRAWQEWVEENGRPPTQDHFLDCRPLTVEEVNELCLKLNCQ